MSIPLIILAILALIGGWVGIPELYGGQDVFGNFLVPVFAQSKAIASQHELSYSTEWILVIITTSLVILSVIYAWTKFAKYKTTAKETTGLAKVLENKWYIDEIYDAVVGKPLLAVSRWFNDDLEKSGFDGIVNGVGKLVQWSSRQIRLIQTGRVGFYIFGMVIGMVVLLIVAFFL
jgi:NADH-quinone oxidoreductase subunit L